MRGRRRVFNLTLDTLHISYLLDYKVKCLIHLAIRDYSQIGIRTQTYCVSIIAVCVSVLQVGFEPTISRLSAECINRLCYCSKKLPRRESHSLEPEGTGFTDPPAYFNGLLRIKKWKVLESD